MGLCCIVCVTVLVAELRVTVVCVEIFGRLVVTFRRVEVILLVALFVVVIAVAVVCAAVWERV